LTTPYPFSIEITLGNDGVRSVRVLGKDWNQSADANALLQRISPLIQKLDAEAKRGASPELGRGGGSVQ
jgi:hypothetical protein